MKRTLAGIAVLASAAMLTGCLDSSSLYPISTPSTAVYDASFHGLWRGDSNEYLIIQPEDEGVYRAIYVESDKLLRFDARLVQLGATTIASLQPVDSAAGIPGHSFARIELNGDTLRIAFPKAETVREVAERKRTPFIQAGDMLVLTAPTPAVQEFLLGLLAETTSKDWVTQEMRRVR